MHMFSDLTPLHFSTIRSSLVTGLLHLNSHPTHPRWLKRGEKSTPRHANEHGNERVAEWRNTQQTPICRRFPPSTFLRRLTTLSLRINQETGTKKNKCLRKVDLWVPIFLFTQREPRREQKSEFSGHMFLSESVRFCLNPSFLLP